MGEGFGGFDYICSLKLKKARMAELVDALVSGTSGRKAVQVRPLFRALKRGATFCRPPF